MNNPPEYDLPTLSIPKNVIAQIEESHNRVLKSYEMITRKRKQEEMSTVSLQDKKKSYTSKRRLVFVNINHKRATERR
jgi:hypothetical protein